jgi:hypothetical protein
LTPAERRRLINQPFPTFAAPHEAALMALPDSVRARLCGPVRVLATSYKWAGTIVGDRFFTDNDRPISAGSKYVHDEEFFAHPDFD